MLKNLTVIFTRLNCGLVLRFRHYAQQYATRSC